MRNMADSGWFLTDDDSSQHVRQLDHQTFQLIEMARYGPGGLLYEVYTDTIHLPDYPDTEIAVILKLFGYASPAAVLEESGAATYQIVAECIFEHYGSIGCEPVFIGSEDDARNYIANYCSANIKAERKGSRDGCAL